jgi:hypothetical protein
MLTLHLFASAVVSHASAEMLEFSALSVRPKAYTFTSVSDIEQVIKSCYKIMEVEPPTFRICTYKEAALLIGKLLEIYVGGEMKLP